MMFDTLVVKQGLTEAFFLVKTIITLLLETKVVEFFFKNKVKSMI